MSDKQKATMLLFIMNQILNDVVSRSRPDNEYTPNEPPERPNAGRWLATVTVYGHGQKADNKYGGSGPVHVGYSKNGDGKYDCKMFDCQSLFGDAGVAVSALVSVAVVPFINMLAVVSLSIFRRGERRPSAKNILLGVVKNPLIQSVFLGVFVLFLRALLVKWGVEFRISDIKPIYSVLGYLSNLATPLALIMLGVQFEFSAVSALKREILFGVIMRTLIVPTLCIGCAYLFFRDIFSGAHFAVFVALFATPVSVSCVPMTQELGGDAILAGQLVVWTTMISAFSVFAVSFLLRLSGVF
jgi:predicted permease